MRTHARRRMRAAGLGGSGGAGPAAAKPSAFCSDAARSVRGDHREATSAHVDRCTSNDTAARLCAHAAGNASCAGGERLSRAFRVVGDDLIAAAGFMPRRCFAHSAKRASASPAQPSGATYVHFACAALPRSVRLCRPRRPPAQRPSASPAQRHPAQRSSASTPLLAIAAHPLHTRRRSVQCPCVIHATLSSAESIHVAGAASRRSVHLPRQPALSIRVAYAARVCCSSASSAPPIRVHPIHPPKNVIPA